MFEDFMNKLRKGIGKDDSTDIPEFPTYEEVTPMNAERNEERRFQIENNRRKDIQPQRQAV